MYIFVDSVPRGCTSAGWRGTGGGLLVILLFVFSWGFELCECIQAHMYIYISTPEIKSTYNTEKQRRYRVG